MKDSRLQNEAAPVSTTPPDSGPLPLSLLDKIRQYDTCTIANVIEGFQVRLRNEGFTREGLICPTVDFPRVVGYAATFHVRSSEPSLTGNPYAERTDWWAEIARLPLPRIAVIEDLDAGRGAAACVGDVHAAILKAFGCQAVITNGAVRDIPGVREFAFPMFARAVAVSHSYSHMVDFGSPVEVFGLKIQAGDLLYADCHGVVSIPHKLAPGIPPAAERIRRHERRIIDLCLSPDFSPEKLLKTIDGSD